MVSIETLNEDKLHPIQAVPSVETEALEKAFFDDLVAYLQTINPDLGNVVTIGFQGFDKKDVVMQLPVKSS